MLHFGMRRAVQLLSIFSCRSSKCVGEGGVADSVRGRGSRDWCWVVDLLKQTWTTGEQQAHIHIHHKTSTILYIDIWTSSPGRKLRVKGSKTSVSALRKDQNSRAMAKRGGIEWRREGDDDKGGMRNPFGCLWRDLSCRRWRGPPAWVQYK